LYKAGGTVTYNGKAVAGANVVCQYDDDDSCSGTTDAAGKFTLTSATSAKGAKAGKGTILVTKTAGETAPIAAGPSKDPMDMMKMMQKGVEKNKDKMMQGQADITPKSELPAKYANAKTSDLKFEITSDEKKNNFEVVLKD